MAKSKKSIAKQAKDNATDSTDSASTVYNSILSTCCCGSVPAPEETSIKEEAKNQKKTKKKLRGTTNKPQQEYVQEGFDETPKFWERIGDVTLFLLGGAPPVKFVRCFECSSVDESELTTPRVLSELASEHDKKNKFTVHSIWSISEDDLTDGTDPSSAYGNGNSGDNNNNNLLYNSNPQDGQQQQQHNHRERNNHRSTDNRRTRSNGNKRWNKLRMTSSNCSSADNSGITEDSYLKKMRMNKTSSGNSIPNADNGFVAAAPAATTRQGRGTVIKHRIRSSMSGRSSSGKSRTSSQRSTVSNLIEI